MISENELRDRSIVFQNSRNVAAELLKTLKRDVPFETEKDILEAHERLTNELYKQYCRFRAELCSPSGETNNPTNTATDQAEVPAVKPKTTTKATVKEKTTSKAVTVSEPAVLAMVQKAVDAVSTKEGCEELKAKILKATKLSLQDQSELIAKLEAKAKAL